MQQSCGTGYVGEVVIWVDKQPNRSPGRAELIGGFIVTSAVIFGTLSQKAIDLFGLSVRITFADFNQSLHIVVMKQQCADEVVTF